MVERICTEYKGQRNDFELIPTAEMNLRRFVIIATRLLCYLYCLVKIYSGILLYLI